MYRILFWNRDTFHSKGKICFSGPLFLQATFFVWVFPWESVQLLSIVSRAGFRFDSCKQSWQSRKKKGGNIIVVSVWRWSSECDKLNTYAHPPHTSFMPHYVLISKDVIASLANTSLINTALVILVTGWALTQLSLFSQNISDPTFLDYVTLSSFRKWKENW